MTDAQPSVAAEVPQRSLTSHLGDPLYRTGYLLIAGSGVSAVLGFVFWVVAAHSYSARVVGLNSAAISAMVLLSGACQLGLTAVLVRYVPTGGEKTRALVIGSYAVTVALSLVCGTVVALTSALWSPSLSFLAHDTAWLAGFVLATTFWTAFTLQDAVMIGLHAAHWVPIENSLYSVAKLVLLLALAGAAPRAGPFVAWNVPVVAAVVGVTALIFRRLIPARRRQPAASGVGRRRLVGLAAGNYAASLFSLGVTYLMPVLVADLTNPTSTAYFYAPWMIATVLQVVAGNTSISMTVEAALDEAQLAQLFRRSLIHTMRLLVPLAALAALAAPFILSVFGGQYAHAGTPLLRLLALSALPNAVVALGLAAVRIQQRGFVLLAIQAGEFVPLTALSLVMLPSLGITGVGVAFLASQTAVAFGLLLTIMRPLLPRRRRAARA